MLILLVLLFIISIINFIPYFTKWNFPKLEKIITQISNYSLIGFLVCLIFLFFDLRFKGNYTNLIITLIFIFSQLLLFGIAKNTPSKIIRVVLVTPVIIMALFTLFIGQVILEKYQINDLYNIETRTSGFLGCGEVIGITETKFVIFDKTIFQGNVCLTEISKIETILFDESRVEFLIYHNGGMDSENPYKYEVDFNKSEIENR